MKGSKSKGFSILVLFAITGAVLGGILGEIISGWSLGGLAPYLVMKFPIFDLPPVTVNLYVINLIIGFSLHPNLISVFGIVGAIYLFRRF